MEDIAAYFASLDAQGWRHFIRACLNFAGTVMLLLVVWMAWRWKPGSRL